MSLTEYSIFKKIISHPLVIDLNQINISFIPDSELYAHLSPQEKVKRKSLKMFSKIW